VKVTLLFVENKLGNVSVLFFDNNKKNKKLREKAILKKLAYCTQRNKIERNYTTIVRNVYARKKLIDLILNYYYYIKINLN
jgi:hypothetical protein